MPEFTLAQAQFGLLLGQPLRLWPVSAGEVLGKTECVRKAFGQANLEKWSSKRGIEFESFNPSIYSRLEYVYITLYCINKYIYIYTYIYIYYRYLFFNPQQIRVSQPFFSGLFNDFSGIPWVTFWWADPTSGGLDGHFFMGIQGVFVAFDMG